MVFGAGDAVSLQTYPANRHHFQIDWKQLSLILAHIRSYELEIGFSSTPVLFSTCSIFSTTCSFPGQSTEISIWINQFVGLLFTSATVTEHNGANKVPTVTFSLRKMSHMEWLHVDLLILLYYLSSFLRWPQNYTIFIQNSGNTAAMRARCFITTR